LDNVDVHFKYLLDTFPETTAEGEGVYRKWWWIASCRFARQRKLFTGQAADCGDLYDKIDSMSKNDLSNLADRNIETIRFYLKNQHSKDYSAGVIIFVLRLRGVKMVQFAKKNPDLLVSKDQPEDSLLYGIPGAPGRLAIIAP
jgi:hypothetical protein